MRCDVYSDGIGGRLPRKGRRFANLRSISKAETNDCVPSRCLSILLHTKRFRLCNARASFLSSLFHVKRASAFPPRFPPNGQSAPIRAFPSLSEPFLTNRTSHLACTRESNSRRSGGGGRGRGRSFISSSERAEFFCSSEKISRHLAIVIALARPSIDQFRYSQDTFSFFLVDCVPLDGRVMLMLLDFSIESSVTLGADIIEIPLCSMLVVAERSLKTESRNETACLYARGRA